MELLRLKKINLHASFFKKSLYKNHLVLLKGDSREYFKKRPEIVAK